MRAGKRRSLQAVTTIVGLKSTPRAEGVRVRSESWRVVSLRWGESICHPGLTVSLEWGTRRCQGVVGLTRDPVTGGQS